MVSAAKVAADLFEAVSGQLARQVHGHATWRGNCPATRSAPQVAEFQREMLGGEQGNIVNGEFPAGIMLIEIVANGRRVD